MLFALASGRGRGLFWGLSSSLRSIALLLLCLLAGWGQTTTRGLHPHSAGGMPRAIGALVRRLFLSCLVFPVLLPLLAHPGITLPKNAPDWPNPAFRAGLVLGAAHSPALAAASAGGNLHRSSPGDSSFNFHNRRYFKPTCMSSGSKGEGPPSRHPCLTLLGTASSPRAFPMTLGLHALAASWPHRRVELGTQSWW